MSKGMVVAANLCLSITKLKVDVYVQGGTVN